MLRMITLLMALALSLSAAQAGTVSLPQTGQTTSYYAGDDGAIRAGVSWPNPRFTDNGDQTVTDNLTGLVWTKDASTPTGGSCTGGNMTWQGALDYVACLNTANYLGHNDWHLPNINELESLINSGQVNIASWLYYQGFVNVQSSLYWSSTTDAFITSYAWYIGIAGDVIANVKSYNFYVWPVRSGQSGAFGNSAIWQTGQITPYAAGDDGALKKGMAWPEPRFTPNDTQMVTDTLTGLLWSRDAGTPTVGSCIGGYMNWQGALNYVKCLNTANYLGYSDWRLPNRKELMSLVDHGTYNPSVPSGSLFSNVQSNVYWASTTYAKDTSTAWIVYMAEGRVNTGVKSNGYSVWPVRTVQSMPTPTPSCTGYTITPKSKSFSSYAGSDSVSVTTTTGCAWTASSDDNWLTITSGSSGTGNGTVAYSVTANNTTNVRSGTMTIAGQTFIVFQDRLSCDYTLTPQSKNFTSSGGSDSVSITASNSACVWTATSNSPSWLIVTSGDTGAGNGGVSYTATVNSNSNVRIGTITIAAQTFTVTQDGQSATQKTLTIITQGTGNGSIKPSTGTITWNGNAGSAQYDLNTSVTLTADGDMSSDFVQWQQCDTISSNVCTVKMTESKTVVVTFNSNQVKHFALTVTKTGTGDDTVTPSIGVLTFNAKTAATSYPTGSQVILKGDPADGSSFIAWTRCDVPIGSQCTVNITADKGVAIEFRSDGKRPKKDFNGDGKADVLWQDTTTGDIYVWSMDSIKITTGDFTTKALSLDWSTK
ncbi:MAG: DUF1566 domain-containing protein [Nitrospirae bacterium]|nr:DUF1566 domain-containing protein [Nitrospirota bacterium]